MENTDKTQNAEPYEIKVREQINTDCLCGSKTVLIGQTALRKCLKCGERFYLRFCWNCQTVVDSRKHKDCDCKWVICPDCGACSKTCPKGKERIIELKKES